MDNDLTVDLIDTHCHLDFPEFRQDRFEVIQRARKSGITYIVNVGSNIENSKKSIELARQYDFIYATVGFHPHEADSFKPDMLGVIDKLAREDKVVAIGEIGLDYYKNYSSAENQVALFASLVRLAKDLNLPLVIHSRNAKDETLKILKEAMPQKVVMHCFSGDEEFLKECLDLGFFISFTCNITYKNAGSLREIVRIAPLERIFLETDAPFLSPEGFRGRRNEPAYVRYLAQELARVKEIDLARVCRVTCDNAKRFFDLK